MELRHDPSWIAEFSKLARLARPVHAPWCPRKDLHLQLPDLESGASALGYAGEATSAPGRIRTGTLLILSQPPLLLGYGSKMVGKVGFPPTWVCTRRVLSAVRIVVPPLARKIGAPGEILTPNLRVRSPAF